MRGRDLLLGAGHGAILTWFLVGLSKDWGLEK